MRLFASPLDPSLQQRRHESIRPETARDDPVAGQTLRRVYPDRHKITRNCAFLQQELAYRLNRERESMR
jgi:hypothetical protein